MQPADRQPLSDKKSDARKAYRRPSVQIYGTLRQMTGAATNPGHALDPNSDPTKPISQQGNNRT